MNVLLVNQYYPPDTAPTGQYLHELARMLVARGHMVTAVCSRRAYNGSDTYAAKEVLDGVGVRRVTAFGFGRRSGVGKLLDYASFYATLGVRLFRPGLRPDVVLALTTPPHVGLLAGWAARACGATHAHWVMDLYPDVLAAHGALRSSSLLYRWLSGLTRRELRGSPLVVCLGDDMAERLHGYADAPTRVESLPLWSDPQLRPWPDAETPPFRSEQGWTSDDLVLMYSGNMGRGHRLGEFLQAASRLKAQPRTHWVFAGGGKRRSGCASTCAARMSISRASTPRGRGAWCRAKRRAFLPSANRSCSWAAPGTASRAGSTHPAADGWCPRTMYQRCARQWRRLATRQNACGAAGRPARLPRRSSTGIGTPGDSANGLKPGVRRAATALHHLPAPV